MKRKSKGIDIKKVLSFFAALSGGGKETREVLSVLKAGKVIDPGDMGEILSKASKGLEKVAREIKDEPTKRWIYREAYIAASMDRKITNKEREALKKIQGLLRISDKKGRDIEKWVEDFNKIIDKGERVIFN
ncbi:MAG: hypothetical protein QW076_01835 [Candidatus Anstonellales archaeon]